MPRLRSLILAFLFVAATGTHAATVCDPIGVVGTITVEIGDGNAGISSCSYSYLSSSSSPDPYRYQLLRVVSTFGTDGPGSLMFSGLVVNTPYQAELTIINGSPISFSRIATELLDRAGDDDDDGDAASPSGVIPVGWSPSGNGDGLSFAQNVPDIVLSSDRFSNILLNEVGGRDYLDFSGGFGLAANGVGILRFGLIAQESLNQPFLLVQRPNQSAIDPVVDPDPDPGRIPEPSTLALLGAALMALTAVRRRRA